VPTTAAGRADSVASDALGVGAGVPGTADAGTAGVGVGPGLLEHAEIASEISTTDAHTAAVRGADACWRRALRTRRQRGGTRVIGDKGDAATGTPSNLTVAMCRIVAATVPAMHARILQKTTSPMTR
jgi:hypothetical protein